MRNYKIIHASHIARDGLQYTPQAKPTLNDSVNADHLVWQWRTGGASRIAPRGPNYKKHKDITRIIGNMELLNSGFHTQKNFSENYLQCGQAHSKLFASPDLGSKKFKEYVALGAHVLERLW